MLTEVEPIAVLLRLVRTSAMHREVLRRFTLRSSDVLVGQVALGRRRDERDVDAGILTHRQRPDGFTREHLLLLNPLHVDDRRFAGDRDGLLQPTDGQVAVDRRREARHQLNAIATERAEPGQRKGDRILTRPEIDNPEPPVAVGRCQPHFFDQRRARRFDRDAGEHTT